MSFGISPAFDVGVGPAAPILANWNLDKNMSLTQMASSIEENRVKFFLWHPAVSGDHDDAVGKSEKQGAISLLFPGAVLPGEQRTAAFCIVQGSGGSSAAASDGGFPIWIAPSGRRAGSQLGDHGRRSRGRRERVRLVSASRDPRSRVGGAPKSSRR